MKEKYCKWRIRRHISPERKVQIDVRLKRIRGQVDGLMKMLDQERMCIDILNQSTATIQVLRSVQKEVLRNYLETCVKTAILEKRENIYDEIL